MRPADVEGDRCAYRQQTISTLDACQWLAISETNQPADDRLGQPHQPRLSNLPLRRSERSGAGAISMSHSFSLGITFPPTLLLLLARGCCAVAATGNAASSNFDSADAMVSGPLQHWVHVSAGRYRCALGTLLETSCYQACGWLTRLNAWQLHCIRAGANGTAAVDEAAYWKAYEKEEEEEEEDASLPACPPGKKFSQEHHVSFKVARYRF